MYSQQIRNMKTSATEKSIRTNTATTLHNFCKREDVDRVKVKDVYSIYLKYCEENGFTIPSPQEFGRAMSQVFGVKTKNIRFNKDETCKVFFL